jgi:SRSO17 transposase
VGVPATVAFKTKPEIALDQIRAALAAGIAKGVVLMDAGYGADTDLRAEITSLGLSYVAGIQPHTSLWAPGTGPLPPKPWSAAHQPDAARRQSQPVQAKALAMSLPAEAWETVTWREGSADWLVSRYARIRVRAAHRDYDLPEPRTEEWLLIEWPEGEAEPTKYRPSTFNPYWF